MAKLHLKRTPAEIAEQAHRKRKKSRRASKRGVDTDGESQSEDGHSCGHRERERARSRSPKRRKEETHAEELDDEEFGPQAGPSRSSTEADAQRARETYEALRAQEEQRRWDERMRDALEDDGLYDMHQRLDGVEARLNAYAHIPRRWRGMEAGFSAGLWMEDAREDIGLEPWQMNDDEYAEYIRAGMWRKQNQEEFAERLRRKEERKVRRQRAAALKEETVRLEREAQAEKTARRAARARRRQAEARVLYEDRWATLLARQEAHTSDDKGKSKALMFDDIPWPVFLPSDGVHLSPADITLEAVSAFLLPSSTPSAASVADTSPAQPTPKEVLRSTILRFHPDKFEARVLVRVREGKERERVKEAAGALVRVLNALMKENAQKTTP